MNIGINCDNISWKDALDRLKAGNERYVSSGEFAGDVSKSIRQDKAEHGQRPFAIVIACSDSRVIPEAIFSCGIGDLFVIRVAGNVVGAHELASVEYAHEHLGVNLALVLGHTKCGAVGAAIHGETEGRVGTLTRDIREAIGSEQGEKIASKINADFQAEKLKKAFENLVTVSAVYDIASGKVDFE